jgi:hypothetical protein
MSGMDTILSVVCFLEGSTQRHWHGRGRFSRMLKNPFLPRLLKKVQMQGGMRKAE